MWVTLTTAQSATEDGQRYTKCIDTNLEKAFGSYDSLHLIIGQHRIRLIKDVTIDSYGNGYIFVYGCIANLPLHDLLLTSGWCPEVWGPVQKS